MIAKIGKGENFYGALSYNMLKVDAENGQVLLLNKISETLDGKYSAPYFLRYFEPYLLANNKTEKPVRHISLNPDPSDKVTDENFRDIATDYMQQMGYGNQPYVVFKHTDIDRTHIHIVSTCLELDGKKISDSYDHPQSMAICRSLEEKYGLKPALKKESAREELAFRPVDPLKGNIKSQIASVVRYLPKYYSFQTLGSYNALLSLFNITAEEVKGEVQGQVKEGMVYFALDSKGEKASNPFKASLFGKHAGLEHLNKHFEHSKQQLKNNKAGSILKATVEVAISSSTSESSFVHQLREQGINTVIRKNAQGRIYGITFIDHESRSVWNGSQLGKNLSANVFNELWKEIPIQLNQDNTSVFFPPSEKGRALVDQEPIHQLFDFLDKETPLVLQDETGLVDALGGLLPDTQSEDYEELDFAHRMRKKRKRGRQ
ncbi:conjugal transfer protein MobB [Sphingobacterium siyangense]|uniref:Relaxase/mobilization nuclease-like protein n=1 Tax=Sphingobacterium siyangense TaxID=459529 RepID=A0A562MKD5_9SPHI|nr:conjugal transfer protein MobB [Sphingobacterium siyangense]TWI20336.1 relaxase/mobilization nuclease-like protein [Sphingobacterium siyangense]